MYQRSVRKNNMRISKLDSGCRFRAFACLYPPDLTPDKVGLDHAAPDIVGLHWAAAMLCEVDSGPRLRNSTDPFSCCMTVHEEPAISQALLCLLALPADTAALQSCLFPKHQMDCLE